MIMECKVTLEKIFIQKKKGFLLQKEEISKLKLQLNQK